MHQQRPPHYHLNQRGYYRYPPPILHHDRRRISPKELLWRLKWPYVFTLILASLMLLFIIIIFILEIASLANDNSNSLSNTASTGAGIWCSIFFIIPVICMYLQVLVFKRSRIWATYSLIAHLIALVFICILIGLVANAVTPYNTMVSSAPTKIEILRAQLALAILMLLFPICFIGAYIYTAFASLYPLRPHKHSVNPPFPVPSSFVKKY